LGGLLPEHHCCLVVTPHQIGELKMPQDNDLNETKAVSKLSKTRNNRDSALLHLMFIRDEITLLPRPRKGQHKKNQMMI
jgi:hypothetical protein